MKQTITNYFCNKCGTELKHEPSSLLSFSQNTYGAIAWRRIEVTIAYVSSAESADESHLCPKCKLYALDEAKKILAHELAEEQQKGEQQ